MVREESEEMNVFVINSDAETEDSGPSSPNSSPPLSKKTSSVNFNDDSSIERRKAKKYKIHSIDAGDLESFDIEQGTSGVLHVCTRFHSQSKEPVVPMYLQFRNLSYTIKETKTVAAEPSDSTVQNVLRKVLPSKKVVTDRKILSGISGKVAPGEFLALMGPTGSGKTTLLGVLARRIRLGVDGEILVNGETPDNEYKRRVAFVLQDDVFLPSLTVKQTLQFTARMRLPSSMGTKEKDEKVEEIINNLNLKKARDTIIGGPFQRGVSGGERKRVNIANEILTSPSIILLDEPTSGLDTSTAVNLVRILREMANAGYTVIASVHQPDSQMFSLFDSLMLLVDGSPIYYGKAKKAVEYFGKLGLHCKPYFNPADFMMGLILREELRKTSEVKMALIQAFKERSQHKKHSEIITKKDTLLFNKTKTKAESQHVPKYPAKGTYLSKLPFLQLIAIALVVGLFWWRISETEDRIDDRVGVLFFIGVFCGGFFPLLNAIYNFPPERAVLQKERSGGSYYLSAYFLAKSLSELPFQLLFPTIFLDAAHFFLTLFILWVSTFTSSSIGFAISARVTDVKMAGVLATIVMLSTMLIAGFYVDLELVPEWIRWARYLSFFKYAFDALLLTEFDGVQFPNDPEVSSNFDSFDPIPGIEVARSQRMIIESIWWNILIVFLWGVVYRALAFVFLKITYKQKS